MNTFDQVKVVEWCWLMFNVFDSNGGDDYWNKADLNNFLSAFNDGTFIQKMTEDEKHIWNFVSDSHRLPLDRKMKSRRYLNILARIDGYEVIRTLTGGAK